MDSKEYFEFGESLHKIKENLEWRKDKLTKSLNEFKDSKNTSFQQFKDRGLLAPSAARHGSAKHEAGSPR